MEVGLGASGPAEVPARVPASGPNFVGMAVSAALAMARFTASGFKTVPAPTHEARLKQCTDCVHRDGTRCKLCGCFTDKKAWLPHEDCPIGKWPE